ncbi:MAG: tetratricopeptide repeat protein [Desulfobacterales bacterium]
MIPLKRPNLAISVFFILAVSAVFWPLLTHDFVSIDDTVYVTGNPYVRSGITAKSITWAFTTFDAEFWHPLTWLSLMADAQIFNGSPFGFHLSNLLLHILNTLLLFFFLKKATGKLWQSAFAAMVFGLHPLHVESVAWIAQRKDVLSTFFWLLTLWCYAHFVEQPGRSRYGWTLVFFILGLMSKPMLVTLPFALLLLDYWPFCRFQYKGSWRSFARDVWPYIREKLPFFGIAAAAVILTYGAQKYGGGLDSLNPYPLSDRIANALISYGVYIWKMIWPQNLAFFYPFSDRLPAWQIMAAALALGLFTILAIQSKNNRPYIIVGWLWYLGTLVPVIGLVKIGDFAMGDRYTYVPLIGLFIIISWGVPDLLQKWRSKTLVLSLAALAVLVSFAAVTRVQTRYWLNSIALYEHAIQVTRNNFLAHYALGDILAGEGKLDDAIFHFTEAVRSRPDKATLQNALGRALASRGRFDEALPHLEAALQIKPQFAEARYNIGIALAAKHRYAEAVDLLSAALKTHLTSGRIHRALNKDGVSDFIKLGNVYENAEKIDEAIDQYTRALSVSAEYFPALIKLIALYSSKKDYPKIFSLLQIDTSPSGLKQALLNGFQNWGVLQSSVNPPKPF